MKKRFGTLAALVGLLVIVPATAAFVPHHPSSLAHTKSSSSSLFSSYLGSLGTQEQQQQQAPVSTVETSSSVMDDSRTKALEARLAALDHGDKSFSDKGFPAPSHYAQTIWNKARPVIIQGNSLKTWSFASPAVERVQIALRTEGRPLDADMELWQGPDNTPQRMRVYVEDGQLRPFAATVETPRGPNTVAIRNTGQGEFPLTAAVIADHYSYNSPRAANHHSLQGDGRTIQGGALRTYPFDPTVESVQVLLQTDGRPLNCRIELLQGPNNNKQVLEVYTEDGLDRPLFVVLETPGSGNVVRVVNTATVEFPLTAWVEPYSIISKEDSVRMMEPVLGGDDAGGFVPDRQWNGARG